MAKEGEELYRILARRKLLSRPGLTEEKYTYAITYAAPGMAPATLFIPEAEWSEDKEKAAILEDIKKRKEFKPEIVRA